MSNKIWYEKTTGNGAVFDDAEDMANWPNFQETQPIIMLTTEQVRTERDALLVASDSMALADRITDEWRTYRAALRDVPAQSGFPNSINWPVEPS